MSVNTQVTGNKINEIQPSKNIGTVVDTVVSGEKSDGKWEYRKITDVKPTQVSGKQINTNYMGINEEGINILKNGNLDESFYQRTEYECQDTIMKEAEVKRLEQEANVKAKARAIAAMKK